jgi:cytochrome c biogenesis protein CcmG/thiol:disulfide interchange protein DsbE
VRRLIYLLPVLIFLVLAGYLALALRPGYDPHTLPSAMIDKEAPAFDLAVLNGNSALSRDSAGALTRDGLKGRPVVINFFASWCVPCQHEQPQLVSFANDPSGTHAVVGVLYEDTSGPASQFLAANGGTWPVLPDGNYAHAVDWGVRGPPESYLVDPDGVVVAKFIGEITASHLDQLVSRFS